MKIAPSGSVRSTQKMNYVVRFNYFNIIMIMIMSSKAEMPRKDEFSFTSATLLLLCDMRDRWEQLWHTSTAAAGDTRNDEQTYVHAALIKQIIASRSALSRFSRT